MSLITELAENRMAGMSKWDEMSKAFAAAAGCEWEAAEALGAQKDWETAEIDLEQFSALLASKGQTQCFRSWILSKLVLPPSYRSI